MTYETLSDVPALLQEHIKRADGYYERYERAEYPCYYSIAEFNRALDLMRGFPDVWPNGVEYWAQDDNSIWWAFDAKPDFGDVKWLGSIKGSKAGNTIGDWRTTLRKRPSAQSVINDLKGEEVEENKPEKNQSLSEKTPTISDKDLRKPVTKKRSQSKSLGSVSDGSTASYYELPEGATELQDLISYRNLNAQDGEMFRAIYRKGRASHSDELRDAKKVLFYAKAEVERLEKLK